MGLAGIDRARLADISGALQRFGLSDRARVWSQGWLGRRDNWPLLCALLRRRVQKREKLYRAGYNLRRNMATKLEPETTGWLRANIGSLGAVATGTVFQFLLGDDPPPGAGGLWTPRWAALVSAGHVVSPAEMAQIQTALNGFWAPIAIALNEETARAALYIAPKMNEPARKVRQAKVILALADGASIRSTARDFDLTR